MNNGPQKGATSVFSPTKLPCGLSVENRLVKVAMYEHLATFFEGAPNAYHFALYKHWAASGWGMIITGNVQTLSESSIQPFAKLASVIHGGNTSSSRPLAIMQLNHAGRQSTRVIGGRLYVAPLAPTSVRVGHGHTDGFLSSVVNRLLFQTPREMSHQDIDEMIQQFVRGAKLALDSGFDGVQLHVAHGYLLSQFLSPNTNTRNDEYHHLLALRNVLYKIVSSIRAISPPGFAVGLKLNAGDYVESMGVEDALTTQELRAIEHVKQIASWGSVDFIEISGGDYENPGFMAASSGTTRRQALFSRFAGRALAELTQGTADLPRPLIILTGGLRTPGHLYTSLLHHADLAGLGRTSVLCPDLPAIVRNLECTRSPDDLTSDFSVFAAEPKLAPSWLLSRLFKVRLVGAGVGMAWYVIVIRSLAQTSPRATTLRDTTRLKSAYPVEHRVGAVGAFMRLWIWVDLLTWLWVVSLSLTILGTCISLAWDVGFRRPIASA